MTINLLHSTPLVYVAHGIRMSHDNHDKSDSNNVVIGSKDLALIGRVGNQFKHTSTLEPLQYIFDIDGISRACLQELARHRLASLTVKSTRYTLNELKNEQPFTVYAKDCTQTYFHDGYERACNYLVMTKNKYVNHYSILALDNLRDLLVVGTSNDLAKYALPEAYKVRLQWAINARSLQNFFALRTSKDALWEIRSLAIAIYQALPEDHKFLFADYIKNTPQES